MKCLFSPRKLEGFFFKSLTLLFPVEPLNEAAALSLSAPAIAQILYSTKPVLDSGLADKKEWCFFVSATSVIKSKKKKGHSYQGCTLHQSTELEIQRYVFFAIKILPEKLIQFNHIKEPITFKQMTSKKGCSFCRVTTARKILKA